MSTCSVAIANRSKKTCDKPAIISIEPTKKEEYFLPSDLTEGMSKPNERIEAHYCLGHYDSKGVSNLLSPYKAQTIKTQVWVDNIEDSYLLIQLTKEKIGRGEKLTPNEQSYTEQAISHCLTDSDSIRLFF